MRRPSFSGRRSATEWGIRSALAMAAAGLGGISVAHSLGLALSAGSPARAHTLAPWDGQITARLAQQRLVDEPGAQARVATEQLARRALDQDPTAVASAATLGLAAQMRDNTAGARRLMDYAQRLSRRNLQAQLWAVEGAVARGDIPGALRHYDIALRTSTTAPDLLFPVLASAISDPAIQSSLVSVLAKQPIWGPGFVTYVASSGADPRATANLFTKLHRAHVPIAAEATSVVITSLVAASAMDEAWRYYAAVRPGAERSASRDPRFTAELSTPSAFDWTAVSNGSVSASIERSVAGGRLDFSAAPGASSVILQQMQVLPAGAYRLEGHGSGIEQPEQSQPYWVLTCRNGSELGRIAIPNLSQNAGVFTGRFDVPAQGCPVQTLSLMVRPSDEVSGVAGQIDRIRLAPVR